MHKRPQQSGGGELPNKHYISKLNDTIVKHRWDKNMLELDDFMKTHKFVPLWNPHTDEDYLAPSNSAPIKRARKTRKNMKNN
jgi:hypothetical protein